MWGMDLVITVPADALAPNGARPSAETVLTDMYPHNYHLLVYGF